jgi:hypothetical protein
VEIGGPMLLVVIIIGLVMLGARKTRKVITTYAAYPPTQFTPAPSGGGVGVGGVGVGGAAVGGAGSAPYPMMPGMPTTMPSMPTSVPPMAAAPRQPVADPLSQPWMAPSYPDFEPPVVSSPTDSTQDAYNVIQDGDSKSRRRKRD